MHPVQEVTNLLNQSSTQQSHYGNEDLKVFVTIRRWFGLAIGNWQRRKMIAALHALEDRALWDIGIERCDIERIVDGFNERELRMSLLVTPHHTAHIEQSHRQAA